MNLANKLTVLRIFLIPVFMILALVSFEWGTVNLLGVPVEWSVFLAVIVFAIASFTDYLDGYLARKNNWITNFGKFADPLADKLLVMTALIVAVGLDLAPSWVIALIVSRELAVTGLRLLLVEQGGTVLAAAWPGKVKTTTQMLAIILLFLNNFPFGLNGFRLDLIMLYISLFFTLYSGFDYFYNARHIFLNSEM